MSIGTTIYTWLYGKLVGSDEIGNKYYSNNNDHADLNSKRWVIFNGEIEIKFDLEEELHHYEITPYSFKPQVAQKITSDTFYDLGQGLLDLLYELELEMNKGNGEKKIGLRKRKK